MHPQCYFRTENIPVMGPFQSSPWADKRLALEPEIATARHARLDEIEKEISLRRQRTKKREKLATRRKILSRDMQAIREKVQRIGFQNARRAAFIGPLTPPMENGHPF